MSRFSETVWKFVLFDKYYAVNEQTKNRKETVIPSSINRKDDFHQVIENFSTFRCHQLCCTYYTFKGKINRHLKRLNEQSVDGPTAKRLNRSCVSIFDFKRNCLIRGQYCEVTPSQRSQKSYFNSNSNNNNNNSKSNNDYSNNNNINNKINTTQILSKLVKDNFILFDSIMFYQT